MRTRWGIMLLSLLLLIPLLAGAAFASLRDWQPSTAWSELAAPQVSTDLVGARRAAGEASSQASMLASGAQQLSDGTHKLADAAPKLSDGTQQAHDGSQKLADALVKVQAGTGQLGDGATKVADGVGAAVDNIVGINAIRGQLVAAIDTALQGIPDDAQNATTRQQLEDLKAQANNAQLDASLTAQLNELKDGSRELANQLDTPGYAYHDGIYQVTQGAKDLNAGLDQLVTGANEATQGAKDLGGGADKVNSLAQANAAKVGQVKQALPASGQGEDPQQRLSPVVAALLAALVAVGGIGIGAAWTRAQTRAWAWGLVAGGAFGLTAAGLVGLFVLATGMRPAAAGMAAAAFALTAFVFAGATRVLIGSMGRTFGLTLAGLGGIVQLGFVGWLWRSVTEGEAASAVVRGIANLLPLHWSTTALTVAGNNGQGTLLVGALMVLGGLAVVALGLGVGVSKAVRWGVLAGSEIGDLAVA